MSFIRRFSSYPGNEVITAIESVSIIDLTPPGTPVGVGTGCACVVGECADMTYGVAVDANGVVSTKPQPVEIFSGADLIAKVGGFDETIGEFGGAGGNVFAEVRGKKYARLIVVPINLASSRGVRLYRDLPTNKSATNPTPIAPIVAGFVAAGREFKTGASRVRSGKAVTFGNDLAYASGIDGAQASNGGPAPTGTFTSAGSDFVTAGVKKGDVLVLGVIGSGLGVPGTYRVTTVSSATQLIVERMDGANFTWGAVSSLPFRLHLGRTADSAPDLMQMSDAGGYVVPARPLTATVLAGTLLTPTVVPPAGAATTWDSLSGLGMATMPGGTDLVYTANVQAINPATNASLEALYQTAIAALLADKAPANAVNLAWAARKSTTIRNYLHQTALARTAQGLGLLVAISPTVDTVDLSTVLGDAGAGVGALRDERDVYNWPGAMTYLPEAVGLPILGADGALHTDGTIDLTFDSWAVSVMSLLQPEHNPGEVSDTTKAALQTVLGYARGTPDLGMPEFISMRARGIMGLRMDQISGPVIQSGITSSLKAGEKNVNRRRYADFIEDSLAAELIEFNKLPLSPGVIDAAIGQVDAFLDGQKSPNNPPAARCADYSVDDKSGNTKETAALGIWVIGVRVDMLTTADFIVIQVAVGPGLQV